MMQTHIKEIIIPESYDIRVFPQTILILFTEHSSMFGSLVLATGFNKVGSNNLGQYSVFSTLLSGLLKSLYSLQLTQEKPHITPPPSHSLFE